MNKRKIDKWNILFFAFVLLAMALIYYFSANNSLQSSAQSGIIADFVMRLFGIEETAENVSLTQTIVRKMAHFTLFALLGTALYGLFSSLHLRFKRFYAVLAGFLVACGDETHQLFVPGRAGMITDVLIDSCGVVTAVLFLSALSLIIKKIKQKSSPDA